MRPLYNAAVAAGHANIHRRGPNMKDNPRRVGQDATGAEEGSFRPKNDAYLSAPRSSTVFNNATKRCGLLSVNSDEAEHEYVGIRSPVCGAKNKSISPTGSLMGGAPVGKIAAGKPASIRFTEAAFTAPQTMRHK